MQREHCELSHRVVKGAMENAILTALEEIEGNLSTQLENLRRLRLSLSGEGLTKQNQTVKKTRGTTIKQEVLEVLAERPEGMTALQILEQMKERSRPNLLRETLSPQLSRLKNDDKKIVVEHKVWRLSKQS